MNLEVSDVLLPPPLICLEHVPHVVAASVGMYNLYSFPLC